MAFVPYYNRRGYNDGLSEVAEAALLNIENDKCRNGDKILALLMIRGLV